MWKNLLCVVAVCGMALMFSGCSTFAYGEARENLRKSANLRIGMTKAQVLETMGEPIRNETYCRPDIWFYYINPLWYDGMPTLDECMPLVFKDDKLIGWGNDFYNKYYYATEQDR